MSSFCEVPVEENYDIIMILVIPRISSLVLVQSLKATVTVANLESNHRKNRTVVIIETTYEIGTTLIMIMNFKASTWYCRRRLHELCSKQQVAW
jgi:hypothetical protein